MNVVMCHLEVSDDMESGLFESLGSPPTGGRWGRRYQSSGAPGVAGEATLAGEPTEGREAEGVGGEVTDCSSEEPRLGAGEPPSPSEPLLLPSSSGPVDKPMGGIASPSSSKVVASIS